VLASAALGLAVAQAAAVADSAHRTRPFTGAKVNGGSVSHARDGKKDVLTLSDDFKVPDAPAPHWQLVDTRGDVYLLQRLVVKGDKFNKTIVVPRYIRDIAKVQIWCAWAETLLGETAFEKPIRLGGAEK